jgi:hypothetical protein
MKCLIIFTVNFIVLYFSWRLKEMLSFDASGGLRVNFFTFGHPIHKSQDSRVTHKVIKKLRYKFTINAQSLLGPWSHSKTWNLNNFFRIVKTRLFYPFSK